MYIPRFFASDDSALAQRVAGEHAFGMLITLPAVPGGGDMDISHLPMLWIEGGGEYGRLIGHVAKANPHGARFDGRTASVAVFSGPHAYISPNWYANEALVPTWNYAAVHLHGMPKAVDDAGAIEILDTLVETFENDTTGNWSTGRLPEGVLGRQIKGIIAFEMPVLRTECKLKMSQNRSPDDIAGVVGALEKSGNQDDVQTAKMMRALNAG
ncbi:FMN-binding negative transcriptional regulator [Thalassospiraceae bacterium LMO-JJ14]|nr:FMN-binding negative transcriptional regulator [Thalassospiraceae bacterium LMO-JJ14]